MIVKFLKKFSYSPNGCTVVESIVGAEIDIPKQLADAFCADGRAELPEPVSEKKVVETFEKKKKRSKKK